MTITNDLNDMITRQKIWVNSKIYYTINIDIIKNIKMALYSKINLLKVDNFGCWQFAKCLKFLKVKIKI